MLKNIAALVVEIGHRSYELHCPSDAPLPELLDAHTQMGTYIAGRLHQANAQQQQEPPVQVVEES